MSPRCSATPIVPKVAEKQSRVVKNPILDHILHQKSRSDPESVKFSFLPKDAEGKPKTPEKQPKIVKSCSWIKIQIRSRLPPKCIHSITLRKLWPYINLSIVMSCWKIGQKVLFTYYPLSDLEYWSDLDQIQQVSSMPQGGYTHKIWSTCTKYFFWYSKNANIFYLFSHIRSRIIIRSRPNSIGLYFTLRGMQPPSLVKLFEIFFKILR